jgi:hypothetical protein
MRGKAVCGGFPKHWRGFVRLCVTCVGCKCKSPWRYQWIASGRLIVSSTLFCRGGSRENRSLLELIRDLGMLMANFPNLDGVLGIKIEKDVDGNRVNALISIEWRSVTRLRQRHVMQLVSTGKRGHPGSYALKALPSIKEENISTSWTCNCHRGT